MKYADMNNRQKKAFRNIVAAANWLIGGLENTLEDNLPGSEEFESAKARLADHEGLVEELYEESISSVYSEGCCSFGKAAEQYIKDIRFCGTEWLMERCERRITKMGY